MAEWAHARTGADLHPGATIGQSFFIDRVLRQICGSDSCVIDQMPA
jgi:serine O-acetyltransferase